MPTFNKICTLSGVIDFDLFETTLFSLDKIFLHCFSMHQQAMGNNSIKITANFQVLPV